MTAQVVQIYKAEYGGRRVTVYTMTGAKFYVEVIEGGATPTAWAYQSLKSAMRYAKQRLGA